MSETLLTVQELADRLGVVYGRVRRFTDIPDVAEVLGGVRVPGQKGLRYPEGAEGLLRSLLEGQEAGLVSPKGAASWIRRLDTQPGDSLAVMGASGGAIVPLRQSSNSGLAEAICALVERLPESVPLDDRLLTEGQAADLLGMKTARPVHHLGVKVGRYRRYRRSDILRWIAGLPQSDNRAKG